ncbi:hypothetical protein [Roseibium algae]|uniref:Curli production assembly/transport component CsgG n=1 Tax=Roseibium algae TaxID=3123038 RepID=A0ABU8TMY0_9HYPH
MAIVFMEAPRRETWHFWVCGLLVLSGCTSAQDAGELFDIPVAEASGQMSGTAGQKLRGKVEKAPSHTAAELLGSTKEGAGYQVADRVSSDDRFFIYTLNTDYGSYKIRGETLLQKHLLELQAVEQLKKENKVYAVLKGTGSAVVDPIVGVSNVALHPIKAAKAGYSNVKSGYAKVKTAASNAGTFIVTGGDMPPPTLAKREKDGFVESFFGRSEIKRKLAYELKVDPYSHFKPLQNELDEVAAYQASGKFGVNQGLSFVPGVGGIIVSGIGSLDSLTKSVLSKSPKEMAALNRKRLTDAGLPKPAIEALIMNPQYTPTEKTVLVGFLIETSSVSGFESLLVHAGKQNDRSKAFAVFEELGLVRRRIKTGKDIESVSVEEGIPILQRKNRSVEILLAYDQLAWTRKNAGLMTRLVKVLKTDGTRINGSVVILSGQATLLAKRSLTARGLKLQAHVLAEKASTRL